MRRVSSCQLIVSWNSFEANVPSEDEDFQPIFGSSHGGINPRKSFTKNSFRSPPRNNSCGNLPAMGLPMQFVLGEKPEEMDWSRMSSPLPKQKNFLETFNAFTMDDKGYNDDTRDPTTLLPYLLDAVERDDAPPQMVESDSDSDDDRSLRRQRLKERKKQLSASRLDVLAKQQEERDVPSSQSIVPPTSDADVITMDPKLKRKQLREKLRNIEQQSFKAIKSPSKSEKVKVSSRADAHRLALASVNPSPPTLLPKGKASSRDKKNKNKMTLQLDVMHQDVQLHIVAFLDVSSARSFSLSSTHVRQLLLCFEASRLWRDWYARRWPHMQLSLPAEECTLPKLVDDLSTPTAGRATFAQGVNVSLLLGMAGKHNPTSVHDDCLRSNNTEQAVFTKVEQANGGVAIQFTGRVGSGDRSIRSDKPMARPKLNRDVRKKKRLLSKFLCRNNSSAVSLPRWRPFVAPFQLKDGSVNVTPRLISYFEVNILPKPQEQDEQHRPAASDCVAVGVATRLFPGHSSMPGWDCHSFAYHGDDGAIFHGSGGMNRAFGPSFGEGDVVGCGVDYAKEGIFYTLNGKMLEYAWTNIEKGFFSQDLFPTVGVDTNCPVQLNFGERPFAFDLRSKVKQQMPVAKECLLACRHRKK